MKAKFEEIGMKHQIAPLIDVVFLLLIYFMVTSSIIKKEGDISLILPHGGVSISDPVEAYIRIAGDGSVAIEGMHFESSDRDLRGLVSQMSRLRLMAASQSSPFIVTLAPEAETLHRRVIDVIDACKEAHVLHLAFAQKNT